MLKKTYRKRPRERRRLSKLRVGNTTLIVGYARLGETKRALDLFNDIVLEGTLPLMSLLSLFCEFMQSCRPRGGGTNVFWWYGQCLLSQNYFRTLCLHGRYFRYRPRRAFRESNGGHWEGATIWLSSIVVGSFRCLPEMVKCRAWEVGLWAVSKARWKVCNCIYLHGKHICSCWNARGSFWDWNPKTKKWSMEYPRMLFVDWY